MNQRPKERMLAFVEQCRDPAKLRQIARNASTSNVPELRRAAQLRLYEVLPSEAPGTLEYDVWRSIHALEGALTDEKNKTIRLARTRQKIARDGERKTVADLIVGKPSEGYSMLIARDMADMTFEAVALRHPNEFEAGVLEAARARLATAGMPAP